MKISKAEYRRRARKAAKTRKRNQATKFKSKPSKTKRTRDDVDWPEAGRLAWITRRRNYEANDRYGKEYKDLTKSQQDKVDAACEKKYANWGKTKTRKKIGHGKTKGQTDWVAAEEKAFATGMLATVLTKEKIKKIGRRWQLNEFTGPEGRESAGIVDLLAIRKDHRKNTEFNPGDLFEIIIIQVKGGDPPQRPDREDIVRMRIVSDEYYAKHIVLAEWQPGKKLRFYQLKRNYNKKTHLDNAWDIVQPAQIFK